MAFLANIGATILFIFGSFWAGTLGVLHIPHNTATTTSQTATTTILYANNNSASGYSKDLAYIYFNGDIVSGADPATFKSFYFDAPGGGDEYGVDKNHVYFFGFLIPGADAATFTVLNSLQSCGGTCRFEAQDKNHKYYQDQIVQSDSQNSIVIWIPFSQITDVYSIKNGKLYAYNPAWGGDNEEEIIGSDPASFVVPYDPGLVSGTLNAKILNRYVKDKNHVYYRSGTDSTLSIIDVADSATFEIVLNNNDVDAQDKNHRYYAGGVICEDPTKNTCEQSDYGTSLGHWYQILQ